MVELNQATRVWLISNSYILKSAEIVSDVQ